MNGKIVEWNDQKGYGFIAPNSGYGRIFLHIKALKNRNVRPKLNDLVSFEITKDEQKRNNATNVILTNARSKGLPPSILFSCSYLVFVAGSFFVLDTPLLLLTVYALLSLFTFVIYAWDKSAAQKGEWRTSESTLHFFSLIGGWPGALIAQSTLRHKSQKQPFKMILWITIVLNCSAFIWLLTPRRGLSYKPFSQ
ncbi:DUF1294 domain-containing protein [Photobacterium sagamiensis]|uniref:DUF1294 domain-containing protein n=1 Tax=Photobacterium sagamiensis TaxID=2910241 RepID=UPI003D0BD752